MVADGLALDVWVVLSTCSILISPGFRTGPPTFALSLRNACFISYRHGQYERMREFVMEFYAALCAELEPLLGANVVFLDQSRLHGGDFYIQALASDLFESATMIMVYTPTYFHWEHTHCAREYAAMEQLERLRLERLGAVADRN